MKKLLLTFLIGLFYSTLLSASETDPSIENQFKEVQENYLHSDNVWIGIYRNKKEHLRIKARSQELQEKIHQLEERNRRSPLLSEMKKELGLLQEKLILSEKVDKRFDEEISLPLDNLENVSIGLISYLFRTHLKKIEKYEKQHQDIQEEYKEALSYFEQQLQTLDSLAQNASQELKEPIAKFQEDVRTDRHYFEIANELIREQASTLSTFKNLIQRKREAYSSEELPQTVLAFLFLLTLIIILVFSRRLIRKTVQDEDRQFAYSNMVQVLLVLSILVFGVAFYSENLAYAATLLGLIGAALVIISKEIVLSFPAWLYILFTGCLRVGDRIQYMDQFRPHIGDIIAISPFRITLYETINHITATEIKRAGRILFCPTHYIFTRSIYNFTHEDMKTILDLIEIDLEFGSDFEQAEKMAIEATYEMTGKYIELAGRQYESLKNKYEMRNFNAKPQIQFLANNEEHCMRMYLWYIAPYREMLNVRSQVTLKILKMFEGYPEIRLVKAKKE